MRFNHIQAQALFKVILDSKNAMPLTPEQITSYVQTMVTLDPSLAAIFHQIMVSVGSSKNPQALVELLKTFIK